jgi:hypothetical protein
MGSADQESAVPQQPTCSMCAASTWLSMSAIPIAAPQKQVDRPSATCVGNLQPASHIARFPLIECAVAPVCCEIGLRELGEQPLPRHVEGGAGRVERLGGRAGTQAAIRRGIEANTPTPLVLVGRHASALADVADTYVVVIDQPSLLTGVGVATAGEGGHAPMIPPIGAGGKALPACAPLPGQQV